MSKNYPQEVTLEVNFKRQKKHQEYALADGTDKKNEASNKSVKKKKESMLESYKRDLLAQDSAH